MRTIAVVTTGRADYGIYLPVLRRICKVPDLKLCLIAGGSHLSSEYGSTVDTIKADGFEISECVECLPRSDSPVAVSSAIGRGINGFAEAYDRQKPDMILVLGDRFEMFAATAAAVPLLIPVAHIHGGEITEGAIDDSFRHAITKLSHLHFVSTEESKGRVLQMGEEAWRVKVSGAPSLDNLGEMELATLHEVELQIGFSLPSPFLLATYHPATLGNEDATRQVTEFMGAMEEAGLPVIFTAPNADQGRGIVVSSIEKYVIAHSGSRYVRNLGTRLYFSLMKHAAAMAGNSSSGIIEAASLGLPVVNVGNRQRGRLHGKNVIDVPCEKGAILGAIKKAISPTFRESLKGLENPYGNGHAAELIVETLASVPLDRRLIVKRFVDLN